MRYRYSTEGNGKLVKKALVYTQNEHKINFSDVDPQAVFIIRQLQSRGFESYIVGGAVRDLILGKKPKDFDIASSASPAQIRKIFRNSRIIGRRFRLVHVFFGPKIIEVSTFRSLIDGSSSNTFGSIEDDVQRRDFTINALFYDPLEQVVVDYIDGMKDIKKGIIKPIIPLNLIFSDDPVRMIRAVKYASMCNFKLPHPIKAKIKKENHLLSSISPSRLTEEIFKIIHSPHAAKIINDLDSCGVYRYLQPKAEELFRLMPGFKNRYINTFEDLFKSSTEVSPAEAVLALIKDYVEDNAPWKNFSSPPEQFRNAFSLARSFVLPMNPPKIRLYGAIRNLFGQHGIEVKRFRFNNNGRQQKTQDDVKDNASPNEGPQNIQRKRRRRRNKNKKPGKE